MKTTTNRQLVSYGDYSSIANCQTKFRDISGRICNFLRHFKIVMHLFPFFAELQRLSSEPWNFAELLRVTLGWTVLNIAQCQSI